ncbi:MAG: TonB-dependent receptor [Proteobacteria bacterium]|nr:MAG: TonB-dependent receptor [Pseudomonadota bacterium]
MSSTMLKTSLVAAKATVSLSLLAIFSNTAHAQESPTTLKEVVVSASGFEQAIKEAPASISVITREELEEKRFNNLSEVLNDVEGIDVGAAAGKTGGLNISIRGMPSDYTLILIDGRRQNSAGNITPNGFGETQSNFIPSLSAIERIEIIRGPMSTLYGSDAMGGIVNIITRKVGKIWSGSLTLDKTMQEMPEFGNTSNASIYASGPLVDGLLGLSLRGGVFDRSASNIRYQNETTNAVVRPTMGNNPVGNTNDNAGARLTLTPSADHDISLDYDQNRQTYDNSSGQLGTLGTGGYLPRQRYTRKQTALTHTGRFGFGVLESSVMQNNTETVGRTIPPGTPNRVQGADRTLEMKSTIVDSKLIVPISAGPGEHILTVGGQFYDGEMEDGVAASSFEFEQWAVFVEDEWRMIDSLALTLGVRHDDHSTFGEHSSPRAYLNYNLDPNWTFKGGVSQGYKTPRLDQLAEGIVGFGGQGTIPLLGTPTLKPETSTSNEIGVIFDGLNGYSASATLFSNEFKDKIASGTGILNCSFAQDPNRPGCEDYGNWPRVDLFGQSVNVDKAITRGAEVAFKVPLASSLSLNANYTYTESEQKSGALNGQPLTDTPKNAVNAKLDWKNSQRVTSWLRGEYRSSRYRGAGVVQDELGNFKAYEQFHLGGNFLVSENVSVNAAVYNILNKDFSDYQSYISNAAAGTVSYANNYSNPFEGRRLWLSTTVTF